MWCILRKKAVIVSACDYEFLRLNIHFNMIFTKTSVVYVHLRDNCSRYTSVDVEQCTMHCIVVTSGKTWTCQSLIAEKSPTVCTDSKLPEYPLTLKCPATCAKANGAKVIKAHDVCVATCARVPVDCLEWIETAYKNDGCAVDCPLKIKLQYRPHAHCKNMVATADRVKVSSGAVGCVVLVLDLFAMVRLDSGVSVKVHVRELVLLPPDTEKCKIHKVEQKAPANLLQAVISGPTQVGSSRCNTVTLNAYESTNPDSRALKYKWKVPPSVSKPPITSLHDSILKFNYLPAGDHSFGLEVTDATGKTARAKDFKMTVLPEPVPVVSLTCPAAVCTRTDAGNYELEVNIYETTTLVLDVELPSNCEKKSEERESLRPIVWQEYASGSTQGVDEGWTPLQVYWWNVCLLLECTFIGGMYV